MIIAQNSIALIGNTPLVRLESASQEAGCDIFGKCEFANPGASVKDRAALFIVRDAEEKGLLKPGGTIVEGTAGNTGIGLALVANALGYRTIIVMPDNQSQEKMQTIRALGAELVTVPPTTRPTLRTSNTPVVSCILSMWINDNYVAFLYNEYSNSSLLYTFDRYYAGSLFNLHYIYYI